MEMGAGPSNAKQKAMAAEVESWPGFMDRTCLTRSEVSSLVVSYRKALIPGEEHEFLRREDFETWMELGDEPSSVQDRTYDVFCVNPANPQVGFYDFMVGICNYCVDHKDNLSMLAFDVYDRHTSGTITEADLEEMLIDVWGPKWEGEEKARALMAERTGAPPMELDEWGNFCRIYPNLLHPIYKIQRTLQVLTLGDKKWAKISGRIKKRKEKIALERESAMAAAVTEEERQKVMRETEELELEEAGILGNKYQRILATSGAPGAQDLTAGLHVRSGRGNQQGLRGSTVAESMDVRDRLKAVKNRSDALGEDARRWEDDASRRNSHENTEAFVLPKFTVVKRKLASKAMDFKTGGDDGGEVEIRAIATGGSNGAKRSAFGVPGSSQKGLPTPFDAGKGYADRTAQLELSSSIPIGLGSSFGDIGSPSSSLGSSRGPGGTAQMDRRRESRVRKSTSSAAEARKRSSALLRPNSMASMSGRHPSMAGTGRTPMSASIGGGSKRTSAAGANSRNNSVVGRKVPMTGGGAGGSKRASRAVVAAGS